MNPVMSVVIPCYNTGALVQDAIKSVLDQSLANLEVIVVDDGSTDDTLACVKYIRDDRVTVLSNSSNRGPAYSRNRGFEIARGKWIAVLDSDDWFHTNRLNILLRAAEDSNADVVCDDLFLVNGEGKVRGTQLRRCQYAINQPNMVSAYDIVKFDLGTLQPIFKAEFLKNHGILYAENLRYGEDFQFVFECALRGGRILVYPQPLYYYRVREGSLVSNRKQLFQGVLEATQELLQDKRVIESIALRRVLRARISKASQMIKLFTLLAILSEGRVFEFVVGVMRQPRVIVFVVEHLFKKWNFIYNLSFKKWFFKSHVQSKSES